MTHAFRNSRSMAAAPYMLRAMAFVMDVSTNRMWFGQSNDNNPRY
jgi:hypothetical protein